MLGCQIIFAQKVDSSKITWIEYVQRVESRKGFSIKLPIEAKLDSLKSGWNIKGQFEKRVYIIPNAGEYRFTTFISDKPIPDSTKKFGSFIYFDKDSNSLTGTIIKRTYYTPTRNTLIEIIPYGIRMQKYIDNKEMFFRSFKWTAGSNSKSINVAKGNSTTELKNKNDLGSQPGYIPYDLFLKKDSIVNKINKLMVEYSWRYSN